MQVRTQRLLGEVLLHGRGVSSATRRVLAHTLQDVDKVRVRLDAVQLQVVIRLYTMSAWWAPTSAQQNSQFLRSCINEHERKKWLSVGSQQTGERAALVLSLIESAKLNRHDPWAYLKDVFERHRLRQRDLAQVLPRNFRPSGNAIAATSAPVAAAA